MPASRARGKLVAVTKPPALAIAIAPLVGDFELASRVLDDALGQGSFSPSKVEKLARDPDHHLLGARLQGELVAVASACLVSESGHAFYQRFGSGAQALTGRRVGSLHASAVLPALRGKGVGSALMRARLALLQQRGCDYVVGISWLSGLAHTSEPVFVKHGFTCLGHSGELFTMLSSEQGFGCPVCGHPYRCSAALYGRPL
jgi:GNAT superfamily N-acetyltransferase